MRNNLALQKNVMIIQCTIAMNTSSLKVTVCFESLSYILTKIMYNHFIKNVLDLHQNM